MVKKKSVIFLYNNLGISEVITYFYGSSKQISIFSYYLYICKLVY